MRHQRTHDCEARRNPHVSSYAAEKIRDAIDYHWSESARHRDEAQALLAAWDDEEWDALVSWGVLRPDDIEDDAFGDVG